jgi:hypothetical protein
MLMYRHQNEQKHNVNICNKSLENLGKFRYFQTTVTI